MPRKIECRARAPALRRVCALVAVSFVPQAKGDNKTHQRQAQKQEKKEVHKARRGRARGSAARPPTGTRDHVGLLDRAGPPRALLRCPQTAQEPHQDYNVGGENCPLPQVPYAAGAKATVKLPPPADSLSAAPLSHRRPCSTRTCTTSSAGRPSGARRPCGATATSTGPRSRSM